MIRAYGPGPLPSDGATFDFHRPQSGICFTPAYVEIEATYLVRGDSPLRAVADVNRGGARVVSAARAARTLFLQRSRRHATVVESTGIDGSFEAFGREMRTSGLLASLIGKHGAHGLSIPL